MVSIRRRKLLGLCAGGDPFLAPHSQVTAQGQASSNSADHVKQVAVHPLPSNNFFEPKEETTSETGAGSSYVAAQSPPKEHAVQQLPEIKRRKRHRRKVVENQEPCIMRGVYFKNMKWQAAIKVDKKQIHLGTVGSQEEAARLYDRAAFMCGREPNFELSEEEKQELRRFKWEEFLAMTRSAITNKKSERRARPAGNKRRPRNGYWEGEPGVNGFSASEEDVVGR